MSESRSVVRQGVMTLPYFDAEVPVLYLSDGTHYIPVVALCRMLGLRPETHIPRWRRLLVWGNACKLPLQTARGTRIVWCLHLGAIPFLFGCFHWSLVSQERRAQLRQATDASLKLVGQAQQEMLTRYRDLRRHLFRFLTAYAHADTQLDQVARRLHERLEADSRLQIEALLSRGRTIIHEATALARTIVHEQATDLIVDVVTIDADGEMTPTGSFPLFPVVSRQDEERFIAYLNMLAQWYREVFAFLDEKGL